MKSLYIFFIRLLAIPALLAVYVSGFSQINTQVNAGPDVSICPSSSTQLNAIIGTGSTSGCQTPPAPSTDCQNCNVTISGSANADVNSGQKVCVLTNTTFIGNLNINGGTLVICGTANPQNVNFNSGHIVVIGSATFNNLNMNNSSSTLKNYGNLTFQSFSFNGIFENYGTVTFNQDFNINSGAVVSNTGTINVLQNLNNNSSFTNAGAVNVSGTLQNNGGATFANNCTVNASQNFYSGGAFHNNGSLTAGNFSYQWTPANSLDNPNIKNPVASPEYSTIYTLTVTGPNGFSKSDNVVVAVGGDSCFPVPTGNPGFFSLNPRTIDSTNGKYVIAPMYVYNRFGDSLNLDSIKIPGNSEPAGIFRLHFFDDDANTGVGFDNNTAQGNEMRAVLVRVFSDISELIVPGGDRTDLHNPYPSDANSQHFIEVDIRSYFSTTGDVANASQWYLERGAGIAYGEVWKTINTGYDSYAGLANPIFGTSLPSPTVTPPGSYFHGFVNVNRFHSFYRDLNNTTPGVGEFDLYSVVLHEVMHMLGIASVMDADGSSLLRPGRYTPYDIYLERTGNVPLLNTTADCYDYQFSGGSLTTDCNTIFFNGFSLTNHAVHSPTTWQPGSSLSHFNCDNSATCPVAYQTNGYVTNRCASSQWVQRTLHENEVRALCDLGYRISDVYGIGAGANLGSGSTNGVRNYTTGCLISSENPRAVAGANDFRPYNVSNSGTPFAVIAGQTIQFVDYLANGANSILDNDNDGDNVNTSGDLEISCLEILIGGNASNLINVSGQGFSYTPPIDFDGQALIRYRPVNRSSGQRGNITYVFVNVTPPPLPPCVRDANNCSNNLVCFGSFEEVQSQAMLVSGNISDYFAVRFQFPDNSPDLAIGNTFVFGNTQPAWALCGASGTPPFPAPQNGNRYIGMYGVGGNGISDSQEGIVLPMHTPLMQGYTYQISFFAQGTGNCNPQLQVTLSENLPCTEASGGDWDDCGTFTPVFTNNFNVVSGPAWGLYTVNYTVPTGTNPLDVLTLRNISTNGTYALVDNIQIIELNTTALNLQTTQISNPSPCPGKNFEMTYEICLAAGATSNASDITVQAVVPNGINIIPGQFDANGFHIIPAGSLTSGSPCVSLTLNLQADNNAVENLQLPIEVRIAAGGQCSAGNTLSTVTDITVSTEDCEPVCLPSPSWATYFGGSGFDKITEIDVKSNGNIIILGNTDGVARNLPVTGVGTVVRDIGTSQGSGFDEMFLAEISADGQNVLWINYIHSQAPENVSAFSLDKADNNLYLAFQHSDNFYSPYTYSSTGSGANTNSLFRFDDNGNIVWSKNYALDTESMQAIVAANDGYLYIAGSDAFPDMFVMKVDKVNAADIWKTLLSIPGFICPLSSQQAEKIVTDAAGNIYVCGGEAYNNCIGGSFDLRGVVYSLNTSGVQRWARRYTGTKRFDTYTNLCTDVNNTIALVGLQNANGFGPNGLIGSDIYLERLDASTGVFIFSRVIGGVDSDVQYTVISDNTGNVYVSGYTASNDILANYSAVNPSVSSYRGNHTSYQPFSPDPTRSQDMLITRFSGTDFIPDWFTYYGSGSTNTADQSNDIAYNIALDNANNLIVVGETRSRDFETMVSLIQQSASLNISTVTDGAIIKFGCNVTNNRIAYQVDQNKSSFDLSENSAILYPNPYTEEVNLSVNGSEEMYSVEVYDGKGIIVYQSNQLISNRVYPIGRDFPAGIYLLRVIQGSEIKTYRLVKL